MKIQIITSLWIVTLLSAISWPAFSADHSPFAETQAQITPFTDPKGKPGFTITYSSPESTAVNSDGEAIKGPIEQHYIGIEEPVSKQSVRIRYRKDEPIIFEFLEPPAPAPIQ